MLGLKQTLTETQKMELMGAMVVGIIHDLNNVSMAVMGHLDLVLLCDPKLAEGSRKGIERARTAAERGIQVMRTVLNFSRAERTQTQVDVCHVLRETEAILRLLIPKGVHLEVTTPQNPVVLCLDRIQLFQVMMNLVVNARDALTERDGSIHVVLEAEPTHVIMKVADTGCGIPEDILPRIFDWQFTTKPEGKGTGLGLSIAKEAVGNLGGSISVASVVGRGTTFTIELPRPRGAATPA